MFIYGYGIWIWMVFRCSVADVVELLSTRMHVLSTDRDANKYAINSNIQMLFEYMNKEHGEQN